MVYPLRFALVVVMLVALVGCGSGEQDSEQGSSEELPATTGPITDRESLGSSPEPAESPMPTEEPEGEVIDTGDEPEGVVADPETGLVAVGLRSPPRLLLVDSGSGEVVETVDLPGSPRHLRTAGPGGPVLVPGEGAAAIAQVSLPDGEIQAETSVERVPHDAAATPDGRIFVINEFSDTMSVIEDDTVIETLDVPFAPGGVASTDDGLVGVVGVQGLALEVFDAQTLESLALLGAGDGPTHVRSGPDNRFYVADTRGDAILIYETSPEPELVESYDLPGTPYGIAIDRERGQLWVALSATNEVVQLALEDGSLRELARYPTVRQPNSVDVDTSTGRVFITGSVDGELQYFDPTET